MIENSVTGLEWSTDPLGAGGSNTDVGRRVTDRYPGRTEKNTLAGVARPLRTHETQLVAPRYTPANDPCGPGDDSLDRRLVDRFMVEVPDDPTPIEDRVVVHAGSVRNLPAKA